MAGNLRSPRKRALEIGTDGGQFPPETPHDAAAGVPTSDAGGTYDNTEGEMGTKPGAHDSGVPFKNLR